MVKRPGLRQVPWQSWEHWLWVADGIFSGRNGRIAAAENRIKAWQGRGNVPISVETTSALISIQQQDPYFNHELSPGDGLPHDMLRMMYAMAIQRLVNGVVDVSTRRNSSSVAMRADWAGLPRLLVDIRHETAHTALPGLPLLRSASEQALVWLRAHYWEPQRQALGNVREELKKKLVEHCQLVIDILTPVSRPSVEGIDEEVDEEGKHGLVKVMRTMRHIHQRNLKVMKQKRPKLFQDLEDLCFGSTSELVSILVDDGLLEQGVLPGSEGRDEMQMESDDSDTSTFDLAAATYTAWRYTICRLSNQFPRLPALLLVAIVKRIGSSRPVTGLRGFASDAAGANSTTIAPTRSLMAPSLSSARADVSKEKENGLSGPAALKWLNAWCAWLLGSDSSEAAVHSVSQVAVKSKILGIGKKLSVKADLNDELCRELLRSCLYISSDREPLDELVSLIALKVGSQKLQQQALMLAKFGSTVQRAFGLDHKAGVNLESDSVLGSRTPPEQTSILGGEPPEATISGPDPPSKPGITPSELDDSNYERVKKQQQRFFARAASEGNFTSRSCIRLEDGKAKDELKPATEGWANSHSRRTGTPHLPRRKWTVAETWRPCALGMIPSPYSVIGILPSLDLHETAEADENMSERQATGGESNSKQEVDTPEDTVDKDRVTGNALTSSVETKVAKRKCSKEPGSPTGGKRAKGGGRHVHFGDVDRENWNPSKPLAPKQMRPGDIEGSRAGQLSGTSLLRGCLFQHGHFLQVSTQQLESLKAAVHVL